MFKTLLNGSAIVLCVAGISSASAADSPEPLPNDDLTVAKLPAYDAHRAYVVDFNLPNKTAGRITVLDGDNGKMLGVIPAGYSGLSGMSPDKKTFYVTTTYYDRGTRGNRADVVEMWDV
jgi:methylamine dehydrogenase heavy chain